MTNTIEVSGEGHDVWSELDRQLETLRSRFLGSCGVVPFGAIVTSGEDREANLFRAARADVTDTGPSYKIVAEVPGIPKEKLDIRVRGAVVEIRGENAQESDTKRGEFVQRERSYSGYYRALELPEPVVAGEAKAKVENGLLELDLPKLHPSPSPEEVHVPVA